MKIYMVVHTDEAGEDYMYPHEGKIFAKHSAAEYFADECNAKELAYYKRSMQEAQERWELVEIAYEAMEKIGMDVKKVFPYHKREFFHYAWKPSFEVTEREVIE